MRVLVACEFSGIVRDAFTAEGHEAWSCDLVASERPGRHIVGDVRIVGPLAGPWDLVVAHPPCTVLSAAAAWKWSDSRAVNEAVVFAQSMFELGPRVAVENPPGALVSRWRRPDQYVRPFEHGDLSGKFVGLWLKGLPVLLPRELAGPGRLVSVTELGRNLTRRGRVDRRRRIRSIFFPGVARSMAEQWGRS